MTFRSLLKSVVIEERSEVVLLLLLALTSGVAILLGVMVVGLLEAPWPVLVSLLGLGFWGLQRLAVHATDWDSSLDVLSAQSSPEQAPAAQSEESATDHPTLTYRGVKYHSPSTTEPSHDEPTTIEGVYRGQPWRRSSGDASAQTPSSSEPSSEIIYRGHKVNKRDGSS